MQDIDFNVISLDMHPDRFAKFLERNGHLKFCFTKFRGIDGFALDRNFLIEHSVISADLKYASGALGCGLSHIALWNMARETQKSVHIAEDDAVFRNDLPEHMASVLKSIEDFDIIYWGFNRDLNVSFDMPGLGKCMAVLDEGHIKSEQDLLNFQKISSPVFLTKCLRMFGILCYTISPKGADKLLSFCLPLRPVEKSVAWGNGLGQNNQFIFENVGVDVLMGVTFVDLLNSFLIFPPLAVSLNTQGPPSTTQTGV